MTGEFDRLFVALLTPFKPDTLEVDEGAFRSYLRYFLQPRFVDAGGAIIVNPEAGEIFYLSREEKRRNVEIAVEECGGTMPVFAGVIDPTTRGTVDVARDAKAAGAGGVFLLPPMGSVDVAAAWDADRYPEVWIDMARAVCDAVDLPAITHPVASTVPIFGRGLPLSTTLKMCAEIPQIVGWKMTYPYNAYRIIARALRQLPRHVAILAASGTYIHENLATGQLDGTVTGAFNFALEPMIDHIAAWRRGDVAEACRIWDSGLAELQEYVNAEVSRLHVRYKVACWLRGLIPRPIMRPPMPKPRTAEIHQIRALLVRTGLDVIEADAVERLLRAPLSV